MIYGVSFDGTNSAGTRLYDAAGLVWERSTNTVAGQDDFANLKPFNVKEVITQWDATAGKRKVLAYKGDANWADLVAAKTGDRMIEIPCFWYSRPSRYTFLVSDRPEAGFKPSPMHLRNGVLHRKIRITKYNLDENYASQTGTMPRANTDMNTFRTNLRAKGMQLLDAPTWWMLVHLMLIKYANMNVQATVGSGRSSGDSPILSGGTDNILGLDGSPTTVSANESVLTLGIENFFSNVWKYIDGLYGYNGKLYIKDVEDMISDPINYQELLSDYTPIGTTYPDGAFESSIKTIAYDSRYDWMQFPVESGSPNPFGDNWWSNYNLNCVAVGGGAVGSSVAGLFALAVVVAVGFIGYGAMGIEIVPNDDNIYIDANDSAYGVTNGVFGKLADDFSTLTSAEKKALFDTVDDEPTNAELQSLNKFQIASFRYDNEQLYCTLIAVPKAQTITPKGLIPLIKYQKIRSVNITGGASGSGVVKIAVTKDNASYQVWDKDAEEWTPINISDIATKGMSLLEVSALSVSAWTALDAIESGIGFAYYLAMNATSDTAYTDEVTLNVELMGELKSLVQGQDYDYGYVANDVLQVKIYKNGDFRINYNPGPLNTKLKLPTVSSSLIYNGEAQSPSFANYNPNKLQISGEVSGTNAGTYTATFTPAIGYTWEDETTAAKNVPWTIAQAESNLTLDADNVSVAVGNTSTVAATFDGDGVLTATAAEGNASVTIEDKNIIVAGVTEGADTITASVADTTNYKGGSAEIAVTITAAEA